MELLRFTIDNIHCSDCEAKIDEVIAGLLKIKVLSKKDELDKQDKRDKVAYVVHENSLVSIYVFQNYGTSILQDYVHTLAKRLARAGYNILSWEIVDDGHPVSNSQTSDRAIESESGLYGAWGLFGLFLRYKRLRMKSNHVKNCASCKDKMSGTEPLKNFRGDESSSKSVETLVGGTKEFRTVLSIGGMTCASCVQSVSESIKQVLASASPHHKGESVDEENFSVSLMLHSAVVIVPNKQIVNSIIQAVDDAGYDCKLLEILPVERSINTKVTALISGISCAACASSIQSAVEELPFVLDCGVNIVTKTGQFVMEDDHEDYESNLNRLKNTIEDCGFSFHLMKKEKINYTLGKKKPRTINIGIEGMFCEDCPTVINRYLSDFGSAIVQESLLTLDRPYIKFTYVPNQEKNLNVRRFLHDLNHLKASDSDDGYIISDEKGPFNCELIEEVSLDEHLRKLAKKETMQILIRLIVATVFVIPTFIFGVVGMSLVPKTNLFRQWLEEPLWCGKVSRNTWILLILSTPVYFFSADVFHKKAFKEIKSLWFHKNSFKRRLFKFGSMNLLMTLGTSVSYFASIALLIMSARQAGDKKAYQTIYFDSVVFLTFFLLIGRLLESYSKSRTADAIIDLGNLRASEATLVERIKTDEGTSFGNDEVISLNLLEVDDFIRVSSGESPPVDCVIISGSTEFDESALTGESIPVKHVPGHQIYSGTVNTGNNSVVAKVVSLEGESLMDQIISTVRDGQLKKAPIERTADLLTGYFVPLIIALALITWIIWLSLGYSGSLPEDYLDIDIGGWCVWSLTFAIAVFVIACPCGIGLAAPTALFVGSGLAAKYGILAKGGGAAFQDGAGITSICFDKTGTLTCGKIRVTNYSFIYDGVSVENKSLVKQFSLQMARDLELSSKHPISKAVRELIETLAYKKNEITLSDVKVPEVENVPGRGLKGKVVVENDDESIWSQYSPEVILGNERILTEFNVRVDAKYTLLLTKWKLESNSIVAVAVKSEKLYSDELYHLTMLMGCRDELRPEAKDILRYLQNELLIECWMITGDNRLTAESIGRELDLPPERVISEVLPEEKSDKVRMVKMKSKIVAMVGDGINDSPALAAADVGIALSSGADLAVSSSDFVLLNKIHPLNSLLILIDLSRCVFRRVKFNFAWSLIYNVIGIPIAAGVIYPYRHSRLNPVWASAAMALSSVSVVSSSLLLKLYKPKINEKKFENSGELNQYDDAPKETSIGE